MSFEIASTHCHSPAACSQQDTGKVAEKRKRWMMTKSKTHMLLLIMCVQQLLLDPKK